MNSNIYRESVKLTGVLRRKLLMLFTSIVAMTLTMVCVSCIKENPGGSRLETGDLMPDFNITLNNGTEIDSPTLRGKPSVIIFFETTCGDCQRELPHLQQAYDALCAGGNDISFFCVARTQTAAEIAGYWTSTGLSMPWSAPGTRSIYDKFAVDGIPRTYIFDASGHLSYQFGPETELSASAIVSAVRSLAQ